MWATFDCAPQFMPDMSHVITRRVGTMTMVLCEATADRKVAHACADEAIPALIGSMVMRPMVYGLGNYRSSILA
ncbi:hypothetical protein Y5A_000280 [Burkholderia glumae AU6208]|nr:hypothetical protein Y5A_000280 [Burkholderia glumae AU6208]